VTAVDTSVVVAAFATWHQQHAVADRAVSAARLPAHCALETYSVLTRLPPPHRAPGRLVSDYLSSRFPEPYLLLEPRAQRALIPRLAELGIAGGTVYDALVAETARSAGEVLVSCDQRAARIYERLGVNFELLR
jgi:predicted nucleic acid-binding protein